MRAREQVFLTRENQARSGQGPHKHRPPNIRPAQPASSILPQRRERGHTARLGLTQRCSSSRICRQGIRSGCCNLSVAAQIPTTLRLVAFSVQDIVRLHLSRERIQITTFPAFPASFGIILCERLLINLQAGSVLAEGALCPSSPPPHTGYVDGYCLVH